MHHRARFVHVNLIAEDWRALAAFYVEVFGCTLVGPERDFADEWLGRATGIPGARLTGAHLRLPGYERGDGPTLELFQYDRRGDARPRQPPTPDAPGFGHIALAVADVAETARQVVRHGGSAVGERIRTEVPGAGHIEFQYLRDPEGNIIEVQTWF